MIFYQHLPGFSTASRSPLRSAHVPRRSPPLAPRPCPSTHRNSSLGAPFRGAGARSASEGSPARSVPSAALPRPHHPRRSAHVPRRSSPLGAPFRGAGARSASEGSSSSCRLPPSHRKTAHPTIKGTGPAGPVPQTIDKPQGGVWGGSQTSPFSIRFGGVYVKAAFSGRKRWRFRKKMNTCLSENSCAQCANFRFALSR